MIRRVAFFSVCLALSLHGFGWAQDTHPMQSQMGAHQHDPAMMMGTPTFTRTMGDLVVKVWVISQEDHKKMMAGHMQGMGASHDMSGMEHMNVGSDHGKASGMDEKTMKEMMAGTHHIAVILHDTKADKDIAGVPISLAITSPSGKTSTVNLTAMGGHSGAGVKLDEKGLYTLAFGTKAGDEKWQAEFHYTVN